MNQRQQNSLTMFKAVNALFQQSEPVWSASVPITETFTAFKALLTQIENTALTQQNSKTDGYTADKNRQKILLAEKAYSMVLKLRAFAKRTNNEVLRQAIDISLSTLEQLTEQNLISRCQIIHDKAVEYQTAAAAYNITAADLSEFQALINAFKLLSGSRDSVGDQMVVATDGLESLFGQGRETLDILDDEVEALISDSNFVAAYFEARKTTDRRARTEGAGKTPIV